MAGNEGMERLIPLVNRLMDVFSSLSIPIELDLPQIAVVGSQSAGKSSVLENFVGRDFLPRGSGIVTRRPLVLQLNNDNLEYGEFLHLKNKRFTNFEDIRREIESETDRLTGKNKGVSNVPINLRIHSPHVLNLTLIDLPGLTKVPVGDQPPDIEHQIRKMVQEFIEKDNCLILAVSPANSDLANSDALNIAKQCDPQGVRTIGVLTKLDLMDEGTNARDILENKVFPLRRGYVGIVNRSQRDIDGRKDITAALDSEYRFFLGHPSYRHMAERLGTPYLQRVLNEQLTNHIREVLPKLRNHLQARLVAVEKEVAEYHDLRSDDSTSKTSIIMRLLRAFELEFSGIIDGYTGEVDTTALSGGAEIGRIFHEYFPYELLKLQFDEPTMRKHIAIAIQNIYGVRPGLFTPDKAFDAPLRQMILKYRLPAMKCVDMVVEKLLDVVQKCSKPLLRFPFLLDEVIRLVNIRVRELELVTKDCINKLIDYEMAYTNTNHEDFVGFRGTNQKSGDSAINRLGNQVICSGWVVMTNANLFRGGSRYFWFVLSADGLRWYTNDTQQELRYTLSLNGVKQRSADTRLFSKRYSMVLFHTDPNVTLYKEYKTLDLAFNNAEDILKWKAAFARAGVFPAKSDKKDNESDNETQDPPDPWLERQVETVRNLVDSYLKIVSKTQRDMVPKVVMHELIHHLKGYLISDLPAAILSQDINRLVQESDAEKRRRQELFSVYEAIKEALDVIRHLIANTQATPLPPPLLDNLVEPSSDRLQLPSTRAPQRPITPPPGMSTSGPPQLARPVPTRPPPNLPDRSAPSPMSNPPLLPTVPQRLPHFTNSVFSSQSASTGNLPRTASKMNGGGSTGSAAVLNIDPSTDHAWRAFDPLLSVQTNTPPVPPPKAPSLSDRLASSDRSVHTSNTPKIPPRPQ